MTSLQAYILLNNLSDVKRLGYMDSKLKVILNRKDLFSEKNLDKTVKDLKKLVKVKDGVSVNSKIFHKVFDLSNAKDKKMYDVFYKFLERLKGFFDDNPDKIIALEKFYGNVYKNDDNE